VIDLTNKQQRVLSYIHKTVAEGGYPPTIREIASHLKVTVRSAHQHVTALHRKGAIEKRPGHRGITLRSKGIPILGRIAAGTPILAEENIEGRLELGDVAKKGADQVFLLRVSGDSSFELLLSFGAMAVGCRSSASNNVNLPQRREGRGGFPLVEVHWCSPLLVFKHKK